MFSGTGWVLGHPRRAHPLTPAAVHSRGATALHNAARNGDRRFVRLLVDANAKVNAQDSIMCAVSARGESAVECTGPSPRRRRPCRNTPLHYAAARNGDRRIVRLLVDANAKVNAEGNYGCAVCACGESAVECAGRVPAAVGRAGTRRCTLPRP